MGRNDGIRSTARLSTITALFTAVALWINPLPLAAQVFVNEVLPNPVGSDTGTERVEIYNAGASPGTSQVGPSTTP